MTRSCFGVLIALVISSAAFSQTLFTYGQHSGSASDFLRAFNKNNTQPAASKTKAMRDYLDLYINSRLKIQEAYERGYDTLPQIRTEVENLRSQIIENYMSDPSAITRMTKEAFSRSLKDIHVGHIFISFTNEAGTIDSTAAKTKLKEVLARLAKEDFAKVAARYSDEPGAKNSGGDMGYITVFTLPYAFENIVYATAPGRTSTPYTSKIGYHIFKNLGERKALGKIKVQQILLAFPPNADDATKKNIARLTDSLYRRILGGDDFASLASAFSNDYISAASGGNVPDISVGQYDLNFEKMIWSLPKDGSLSRPFLTSHGYHIVKRLSSRPVVTDPNDKTNNEELRLKIMSNDRWNTTKDFIYERVYAKPGIKKTGYSDAALWALSDSLIDHRAAGVGRSLTAESPLFTLGDTTVTVASWISYAQSFRYKPDRSGIKPYPQLWDEFMKNTLYEYYRQHLEEYSEEFRMQMQEFHDGNLLFEIMQQEIWNRTQSDSSALLGVYEKNKSKYNWGPSAEVVIFFCPDAGTSKSLMDAVKKDPANWKKAADAFDEKVTSDSARYEWAQIPGLDKVIPTTGLITKQVINETDNTASFAYIIKVYKEPAPRTFSEAKGLVMNDYQSWLEEQWLKELKKKYPVTVDQKVFAKISQ